MRRPDLHLLSEFAPHVPRRHEAGVHAKVHGRTLGTHIAELNISRFRDPTDEPRMRGSRIISTVSMRSRIGARASSGDSRTRATTAERSDRQTTRSWLSTRPRRTSRGSQFVWATAHKRFCNRKGEWFALQAARHFVLWPVEEGHIPRPRRSHGRLDNLTGIPILRSAGVGCPTSGHG
jgi:hypothetical protein